MSENKRRIIAALMMVIWLAAGPIFASDPKTFESGDTQSSLIELFTSEGCSSCPSAEKWLSALKSSSDLWKKAVPVAFHVDYWDHLGWRDRFAKPEFTSRQHRYAAAWGGDSVYTPSFVVNGKEWRDWFGGNAMPITSTKVGVLRVSVGDDGKVSATFAPGHHAGAAFDVERRTARKRSRIGRETRRKQRTQIASRFRRIAVGEE